MKWTVEISPPSMPSFVLVMLICTSWSSVFIAQCPSNSLLPNPSFEDYNCCPDAVQQLSCANNWIEAVLLTSPTYFNVCDYMGLPPRFSPPDGFPDGRGCLGLYYRPPISNAMALTCSVSPLDTSVQYVFSAYAGFNLNSTLFPSHNPTAIGLWATVGACPSSPIFPQFTFCPPASWDLLATIDYSFGGDQGWVFGESDCFQPSQPYSVFVIATICTTPLPIGMSTYNYYDLIELQTCQDLLDVSMIIEATCGTASDGSIDLIVGNGTPPYVYDWDIDGTGDFDDSEDQTGLSAGSYVVMVMDANGLSRCLDLYVNALDVIPTSFDAVDPLCQGDPMLVLPAESQNDIVVTGTWTPDTVFTDSAGIFSYVFHPDSSFCADSFVQFIQIKRQSIVAESLDHMGCQGDNYQLIINGTTYDESNPVGQQIINTNDVCDSTININLIFNESTTGVFEYTECAQSGYSILINGTTYDEDNPDGTEVLLDANNCDSVLMIDLDFLPLASGDVSELFCSGSGVEVMVNGTAYNEANPTGSETLISNNGCDSIVTIDLFYHPITTTPINYQGCLGDMYQLIVNGTVYDEFNPTGSESLQNVFGCDSIVTIDLIFSTSYLRDEMYSGCVGDGYTVTINGIIYDEINPTGSETLINPLGCDTVVTIDLQFANEVIETINHAGCLGDGYAVTINGTIYDENNPTGSETLINPLGCDTIVTIDLLFASEINEALNHQGCIGDGFTLVVNNNTYNELNPAGVERMTSAAGCDSVVTINLQFSNEINEAVSHEGCLGDGFEIVVNNNAYDELNPSGVERMTSAAGCDSVVTIDLQFFNEINEAVDHQGCIGDGFEVVVNNNAYNELNPSGVERMTSAAGCDSVVTINLQFSNEINEAVDHQGCIGDGFEVLVNNNTYDELNPTGVERMTSASGCDSVVTIDLQFSNEINEAVNHQGCIGDGFAVVVNNSTYNELNPSGVERMTSAAGCDSVVTINLQFSNEINVAVSHQGCIGDGFEVIVNNITYSELNPNGIQRLPSAAGCDSIVSVELEFKESTTSLEQYTGCIDDGYEVVINQIVFSESNPSGIVTTMNAVGCDSIINVELEFLYHVEHLETFVGCSGDAYEIIINNVTYNESNPRGQELLTSANGCDSLITIELEYLTMIERDITHDGCADDGFALVVNGQTYDESNTSGIEIIDGGSDCDTLVTINLQFRPTVSFEEEIAVMSAQSVSIDISAYIPTIDSITSIQITPSDHLSCDDCLNPTFTGEATTTLQINITDSYGCLHTGRIHIITEDNEFNQSIFIPTVFSPNNDGINDYFQLFTAQDQPQQIKSFQIFNRWGDRVFIRGDISSDDNHVSWDGTVRGRPASDGVYVYVLELTDADDGVNKIFGEVTLMR